MAEAPLNALTMPGFVAAEESVNAERFYISVEQVRDLYCMDVSEAQIRFAMDLMHNEVNRPSLWPEQYNERLEVPDDRNQVLLAARPVLAIVSAQGRYGYGRRDRRSANIAAYDAMAITALFGSPPGWIDIDVNTMEVRGSTGEVWLPSGMFLANFSEVNITYTSGLVQVSSRIKSALIDIINTVREKGVSDRTSRMVGRVQSQFAGTGFVSETAKQLLSPYVIRSLY